ncbi:unnamed protein product [Clavelina lepadiformis]|uniref:BZIP domain-containing protein n=1 Tax=Clavelina lepadiformis TaxID=159417 RepID=A0ABP0GXY7_CLALP
MESMYYSEVPSLFGGNLLEEAGTQFWVPEGGLVQDKVEFSSAGFMHTAPKASFDVFQDSFLDFDMSLPALDNSNQVDISALQDLVDDDFHSFALSNQGLDVKTPLNKLGQPLSPASSIDSGVGSPQSDLSGFGSYIESASPSYVAAYDDTIPQANVTSSSISFDNTDELLEQLGITIVSSPEICSVDQSSIIQDALISGADLTLESLLTSEQDTFLHRVDVPVQQTFIPKAAPLHSKLSLPKATEVPKTTELRELMCSDDVLSTSSLESLASSPVSSVPSSPEFRPHKCGRKSKVNTTQERKQRKRDQNKNAATRYREKKRLEQQDRDTELSQLDGKNKSLRDKVTQISREIDYLKELMLEVYKIKGLLS